MSIRPSNYRRIITPFGVLESIGVKIKSTPTFKYDQKQSMPQNIARAFKDGVDYFKNQEYLNIDALKQRYSDQSKYWDPNPDIQEFIADTIQHTLFKDQFDTVLYDRLAFDHIFTIANWEGDRVEVNKKLLVEGLKAIKEGLNIPLFRVMYRVHSDTYEILKNQGKEPKFPFELGSKEDLLDTEIIHYPIFGAVTENNKHRVIAITEDDKKEIHNRLTWSKMMTNHLLDITPTDKRNLVPENPIYGDVFALNKETGLFERIKVKKLRDEMHTL